MTQRTVILFARTPEAEVAAKGLSRQAVVLFETLTANWLRATVAAGARPLISCDPESRSRFASIAAEAERDYVDQEGDTFGERVAAAASHAEDLGFRTIAIAGIDAPPPVDLERSFELLESGSIDGAIAPSRDGGVNIIAFRAVPFALLLSFEARDASIAARCVEHFARIYTFAPASDIDCVDDIARAMQQQPWRRYLHLLAACRLTAAGTLADAVPPAFVCSSNGTRGPPASTSF
jgi:glycosyltransferase A (GT-A) superfamily protein (DUF2064 family)